MPSTFASYSSELDLGAYGVAGICLSSSAIALAQVRGAYGRNMTVLLVPNESPFLFFADVVAHGKKTGTPINAGTFSATLNGTRRTLRAGPA